MKFNAKIPEVKSIKQVEMLIKHEDSKEDSKEESKEYSKVRII